MKKYLFNGAMALIVGGFIVSCSHDDISQPATVDQMTKSFDEMFTELYGPIAENHTWGFNTVEVPEEAIAAAEAEAAAATRAATRKADPGDGGVYFGPEQGQTYKDLGIVMPDMVSADEEKFVSDWFKANKNPESDPINLSNFFVLQVYFGNYEYKSTNSGHTSIGGQHMDELCAGSSTIGNDIINNYNANSPARYWTDGTINYRDFQGKIMLMLNSSTERFGYKESQNTENKYYYNFVIKALKYNDKWGYYVGFDYENHGQNGNFPADGFYDDRIIKIVPGNGIMPWTPTENPDAYQESKTKRTYTHKKIVDQGRVFCEDIATAYRNVTEDIDYNDIVFDARVWEICDLDATTVNNITTYSSAYNYRWQYDISLLATGGTIEEKVNGVDVHNKLGVGPTFMVNTWTPNCVSTLSGQWNTPTNVISPVDFSYTLKYEELPDAPRVGISTIPIEVKYDGTHNIKALDNRVETEVTDSEGKTRTISMAPYKLCLPIGKPWPIERVNIKDAYKSFSVYVENPDYEFYNSDTEDTNLYTQAPESSIQKDGKTTDSPEEVTQSGDAEESNVWVVWKGNVSSDATAITLYNFTFQQGQVIRFFGTGTITVAYGANNSQRLISSGSMSDGYVDVTINSDQASALSDGIMIYGSNFTLTKIVVL